MVLTRLGENSKMVINGDPSQIDLQRGQISGLNDAEDALDGVEEVAFIRFNEDDVVRHNTVARIIKAYDKRDKNRRHKTSEDSDA